MSSNGYWLVGAGGGSASAASGVGGGWQRGGLALMQLGMSIC